MGEDERILGSLVDVLVEAGILEPTGYGAYKVSIDIVALQEEVELLKRQVKELLKE